jgi:hypothetical protein
MPFDGVGDSAAGAAVAKIDRVIRLLAREQQWCKQQTHTRSGKRCLRGAMMDVDAAFELDRPIKLAIRQVTGRDYAKIEMFNDQPLTTHALVLAVLRQARQNILDGMRGSATGPTAPAMTFTNRPSLLGSLRALFA